MTIRARLHAMGRLVLPAPMTPQHDLVFPFEFARIHGIRVLIPGHGSQQADGSIAAPLGKLVRV